VKQRPKFLYFDIDDTILDHKSAERAALHDTRLALPELAGIDVERLQQVYHLNNARLWKDYGAGNIDRAFLEENRFAWTLRDLGVTGLSPDEMRQVYMRQYARHWTWIPGARQALTTLIKWYPIGFLTNGFAEIQHAKAEQFQLHDFSQVYLISEEIGFMKPQPGIFEFATRQAGVHPHEILYVGDSFESDIVGGGAFGWRTAWFTGQTDVAKTTQATLVFDDFTRLVEELRPEVM